MKRKIAIPLEGERLAGHFGHCEAFAIIEAEGNQILRTEIVPAPVHEHGGHPRFLAGMEVTDVIAGGMGPHAVNLLKQFGVNVILGAPELHFNEIAQKYLEGQLQSSEEACHAHEGHHHHDHHHHDHHHHHSGDHPGNHGLH